MALTIPEVVTEKKKIEKAIAKLLTDFEKEAQIKVNWLNYRNEKYDEKKAKRIRLKSPEVTIEVNIDDDPRSIDTVG